MFHYAGDGSGWMGVSDGAQLSWHVAGSVAGPSALLDLRHRIYVADHDGDYTSDLLIYDTGTGEWTLGRSNGNGHAGNTSGFGDLLH
jgi:hypothetical protein